MLTRNPSLFRHERGVTMIEMMVGIVVGLIVLWGMSTVYVNTARGSRTTTSANALNQDMRAMMDILVGDIRRAGYWSTTVNGVNPFTTTVAPIRNLNLTASCVLYSYDATHRGGAAGAVDPGTDFFGFRRAVIGTVGVVQTLAADSVLANTALATCANAVDVDWESLSDDRAINITTLTFDTVGSQCIAYMRATYNPNVAATYTRTNALCDPVAAALPAGTTFVETRLVNITMTARSVADPTLPERTLTETVLVRNNRVINT